MCRRDLDGRACVIRRHIGDAEPAHHGHDPPPSSPVHRRVRRAQGTAGRGRLEQSRSGAVALAYTEDSQWRNRSEFFVGRAAIRAFLARKWEREHDYRLIKEVWAFAQNRIAVRFVYESVDDRNVWSRAHGNEQWEFDEHGLMRRREASINDVRIDEGQRLFHWPLGPRPDGHPGLTELGL